MNNQNPIIIELLKKRGIEGEEDVLEFLSEKPKRTYDPFLLHNMEAGVDLLLEHIKKDSKICIYGDYDADGMTAVAVLTNALSHLTKNSFYYIPSRFEEGYGLNKEAIGIVAEKGADLVITVDCGSVSYDEVEYAKELGLDIIVTDHHSITDKIADCILINPKQPACQYPFKHLCGVGVIFKLVQALCHRGILPKSVMSEVLDLVAVGTIGDIVPLVDENRTIVKFGLKQLNRTSRKGLLALINRISLVPGKLKSDNVAYAIVPHLNAAGRMKSATLGVKLLLCEDEKMALELAEELVSCNALRKTTQEKTYKKCIEIIKDEAGADEEIDKILIINAEDAHEGITGIVAGKLKDEYFRPVIIITPSGKEQEYLKGTGRSPESINLYELLKNVEGLFEKFGGHAGACGFLMKKENLLEFKKRLNIIMEDMLEKDPSLLKKKSKAEMTLTLEDVDMNLGLEIEKLAPFGFSNQRPEFEFTNVLPRKVYFIDQAKKHVRFELESETGRISCILFNKASEYEKMLLSAKPLKLEGSIEVQEWRGVKRLQLITSTLEEI